MCNKHSETAGAFHLGNRRADGPEPAGGQLLHVELFKTSAPIVIPGGVTDYVCVCVSMCVSL